MSLVDDSGGVCGCGWVVGWVWMAVCGGGGDGRKSTFYRGIVLMIRSLYPVCLKVIMNYKNVVAAFFNKQSLVV